MYTYSICEYTSRFGIPYSPLPIPQPPLTYPSIDLSRQVFCFPSLELTQNRSFRNPPNSLKLQHSSEVLNGEMYWTYLGARDPRHIEISSCVVRGWVECPILQT